MYIYFYFWATLTMPYKKLKKLWLMSISLIL